MLTIRKIRVASGNWPAARRTAEYVLDPADSPAAVARALDHLGAAGAGRPSAALQPTAAWLGTPAMLARLGVEHGAPVSVQELALALQGRHAVSGERVRAEGLIEQDARDERGRPLRDGEGRRVKVRVRGTKCVDLTFSAPKSVSVAWSQARPYVRAQLEAAMLAAAEAMLVQMTTTKPVVAHRRALHPARGYAAAAALHVRARAARGESVPAPQLHVHGIVLGVEREDGFFAAPELSGMFKHGAPLEGGAVARAKLAEALVEMGFEVACEGRFFEIAGVPPALVERMSARTRDVIAGIGEREAARGRPLTDGERAVVAFETRPPKGGEASLEETVAAWTAEAARFGFGPVAVDRLRLGERFAASVETRRAAVAAACAELRRAGGGRRRESTGAVRAAVLERAAGRLRLHEVLPALDELAGAAGP